MGRSAVLTSPFLYAENLQIPQPSWLKFNLFVLLSFIQAQARKEELRKQPEQVILSEVRQVVQQMQALNQHLDEAVSLSRKKLIHCLHGKCTQNFTRKLLVSE